MFPALKHQHEGHLKAVVVSNMSASISSFIACAQKWKKTLPPDLLAACEKIEKDKDWENPQYEKIIMEELYPSKCSQISILCFCALVTIGCPICYAKASTESIPLSTLCALQ